MDASHTMTATITYTEHRTLPLDSWPNSRPPENPARDQQVIAASRCVPEMPGTDHVDSSCDCVAPVEAFDQRRGPDVVGYGPSTLVLVDDEVDCVARDIDARGLAVGDTQEHRLD